MEWTDKDYWMFIILYGRNASTYKMGLGKSLMDLGRTNSDKKIRLDELGEDLFNLYQKRLANGLPQMGQLGKKTVVESKLDELKVGRITKENAITEIAKNAKVMVLEKFHNLDQQKIPRPFFTLSDDGRYLKLGTVCSMFLLTTRTRNWIVNWILGGHFWSLGIQMLKRLNRLKSVRI